MDIIATGMVCSVGLTAASACAAIRARIAKFDDLPFADNQAEPIVGAAVPGLDPGLTRRERLVELLAWALEDCRESGSIGATGRIPLLVGLAEPGRPGGGGEWAGTIIGEVEGRLKTTFDPGRSASVAKGHTSAFECLRAARELLKDPNVPGCLVCGVDSYINARSLLWLERHGRLKTPANSDGVIPGEAAACALMVRPGREPVGGIVTRVAGLGFGKEDAPVLSEEPLLGLGLAEAGRAALAEAGLLMQDIDYRVSDVTGESYGFREQALLVSRLLRVRRENLPIWHGADSIGDTGAAAGVCQLVLADHASRRGHAPGRYAMGFCSAVPGDRASVVLERRGVPDQANNPVPRRA